LSLSARGSNVQVGIQTAQLLLNAKRHDELKRGIKKSFPLVPDAALNVFVRLTAAAFRDAAPEQLRRALRPGGMEAVRPQLEQSVVDRVMKQPLVAAIPVLNKKEKKDLVATAVDLALDVLLEESSWVLSSPQVRLESLQNEIDDIARNEMNWVQRVRWKAQRHPLTAAAAAAAATAYVCVGLAPTSWLAQRIVAVHGHLTSALQWTASVVARGWSVVGKLFVTAVAAIKASLAR
jgi:hypothetical protein